MSRAPVLAAVLGYRDISLFGADSCYSGETTHVYGATLPGWPTGIPAHAFHIYSNGRVWLTDLGWLAQAEYLAEMIPVFPFPVRLMGDHLASALLASQEWKLAA